MTDIEERLRAVETQTAVNQSILQRMEQDLASIASSSNAIQQTVTKWKGGMGALVLVGGTTAAAISLVVDMVSRKLWP